VKFDAVVFGNSVRPGELQGVRRALTDDGIALVPVCSRMEATSGGESAADAGLHYCVHGLWWLLGRRAGSEPATRPGPDDVRLFPYRRVMRPINASLRPLPEAAALLWGRPLAAEAAPQPAWAWGLPAATALRLLALVPVIVFCLWCALRRPKAMGWRAREARTGAGDARGALPAIPGRRDSAYEPCEQ